MGPSSCLSPWRSALPWRAPTSLLAALAVVASAPACRRGGAAAQGPPPAVAVEIQEVLSARVDEATEYVASLRSRNAAEIMPQVEGEIRKIYVRSGERVAAGARLVQIDSSKQQAAVKTQEDLRAARRAALEFAKQQHERIRALHAQGITSAQDLDQAKTALEAAEAEVRALEAQVEEQRVQLAYHEVAAPTAGIVGDLPVQIGDRVTTTTLLTTIDQAGGLEVYVNVPVERAPLLRPGLGLQVLDAAGAVVEETRIAFVAPRVDDATQTILVKAPVPNDKERLRTQQFAKARVIWGIHEGPVVPVLAVSRISGQYFVFVAEDEKGTLVARQRPLKVGEIVGNDYLVLEGIKAGDKVVVSGTQFLTDGAPVRPAG